jgi:hypothetical protein
VTGGSPLNLTLLLTSYQNAYGNPLLEHDGRYEAQHAADIETLLPSTTLLNDLEDQASCRSRRSSAAPARPCVCGHDAGDAACNLAVARDGFGADNLLTNDFRLAYLQDADAHPTAASRRCRTALPPAAPENAMRQALKTNDQRASTPTAPMLPARATRSSGALPEHEPAELWSSETTVSVLDIDSTSRAATYENQKEGFAVAKALVELAGGDDEVLQAYWRGPVAPFCSAPPSSSSTNSRNAAAIRKRLA